MAVSLKKILKSFNGQRDVDCVFGYIRKCQPNVPNIVMHVVVSYYHLFRDEWDLNAIGSGMKVSEEGILTYEKKSFVGNIYNSAFLTHTAVDGINKWTFKVIDYDRKVWHYNYLIGIWNIDSKEKTINDLKNNYFSEDCTNMYGYLASCGRKSNREATTCFDKYGVEIENNDIIEMQLDLDKLEMKFSVNGKDLGKAFDVKSGRYRAAVMLASVGNKIQILPNAI